jgi:predicted nucleotidyltransferase component of viral defense system
MKDLIAKAIEKETDSQHKKLAVSEFLQHLILQSIYRHGFFRNLVFTGGIALRILYHTNRYSEDLDFSLVDPQGFRFDSFVGKIQKDLELQQLKFEYTPKEERTVANANIRFSGILQELKISPLKDQKLTVKIEVDKNPPEGGKLETALIASPVSYTVTVFDLSSLFATKLHAIFFRGFTKGRDYYDLMWFLGRSVKANFRLLNNAIRQTHGNEYEIKESEFKEKLMKHLESVDFVKIRAEVERFMISREELKLIDFETIKSLLRNY